jgi:hypothetical protein
MLVKADMTTNHIIKRPLLADKHLVCSIAVAWAAHAVFFRDEQAPCRVKAITVTVLRGTAVNSRGSG